jgi:hypothetical protein
MTYIDNFMGLRRYYRDLEYWEALPYPGSPGDFYHYADYEVSDRVFYDNVQNYSGSPDGIQAGTLYTYGSPHQIIDGKLVLAGSPQTLRNNPRIALTVNETNLTADQSPYGIVTMFKELDWTRGGSPDEYPVGFSISGDSGNFGRGSITIEGADGYYWQPRSEGIGRIQTAIVNNPGNLRQVAFMSGGYRTPIVGGVMGGYVAGSPEDDTAKYGNRGWVKHLGERWKLVYINAVQDSSIYLKPEFTNRTNYPNNDTLKIGKTLVTRETRFRPTGLQKLNPDGFADPIHNNWTPPAEWNLYGTAPTYGASGVTADSGSPYYLLTKDFGWSDGYINLSTNRSSFVATAVIFRKSGGDFLCARHMWSGGIYNDVELVYFNNYTYTTQLLHAQPHEV